MERQLIEKVGWVLQIRTTLKGFVLSIGELAGSIGPSVELKM
jgi:hypothetical protein